MVSAVSNFKGFIAFVIIFLLIQQSFAAFMPMNCDDLKGASVARQENNSHMISHVHEHKAQSKDKIAFQHECDICDPSICRCNEKGGCFGSSLSMTIQQFNHEYMLFVDHAKRFSSPEQHSGSGINTHPFRPPITI